jgi:hypothetical protein
VLSDVVSTEMLNEKYFLASNTMAIQAKPALNIISHMVKRFFN